LIDVIIQLRCEEVLIELIILYWLIDDVLEMGHLYLKVFLPQLRVDPCPRLTAHQLPNNFATSLNWTSCAFFMSKYTHVQSNLYDQAHTYNDHVEHGGTVVGIFVIQLTKLWVRKRAEPTNPALYLCHLIESWVQNDELYCIYMCIVFVWTIREERNRTP
jgi:hypothetical protein